jgi:hypothetical protein
MGISQPCVQAGTYFFIKKNHEARYEIKAEIALT